MSAAEFIVVYSLKGKKKETKKSDFWLYIFKVYIQSIVKNVNESVTIFMFSQAADGLFDYIKSISQ